MSAIRLATYVFITLSPDGGTRSFHAIVYRVHFDLKKGNVRVRCSFLNEFGFFLPPLLSFACGAAQRGYTWKVEMIKKKEKKRKKLAVRASVDSQVC